MEVNCSEIHCITSWLICGEGNAQVSMGEVRHFPDRTGNGSAEVSFSGAMCEGQCDQDCAKVNFSEAQRQTLVMAMRR